MRKRPETFSDILTMPFMWPEKGDRLLRSSDDWNTAATFSEHRLSRDVYIWDGYMTAGAALVDEAEREPADRDVLVYPILFNYRHGLEMAMKWTIEQYGAYFGLYLDEKNHDLLALWRLCKQILIEASPHEKHDDLEVVEGIVKELHDWDKYATAFRYSTDKNGVMIPLPDHPIDLANVQRIMEKIDNFFTGADGMLDHHCSSNPC